MPPCQNNKSHQLIFGNRVFGCLYCRTLHETCSCLRGYSGYMKTGLPHLPDGWHHASSMETTICLLFFVLHWSTWLPLASTWWNSCPLWVNSRKSHQSLHQCVVPNGWHFNYGWAIPLNKCDKREERHKKKAKAVKYCVYTTNTQSFNKPLLVT